MPHSPLPHLAHRVRRYLDESGAPALRWKQFSRGAFRQPVTRISAITALPARLRHELAETFGDEIANELVDWLNTVDATYRADLRELNELNFARFDAKLEHRIEQLSAELRVEIQRSRADLIKWMFVFWAPTALGVVTTGIGVISLVLRR